MNSKNETYRNLARDTALFAISNFGSKILVFLLTPLYTAILTTAEYGIVDIIVTTVNFVYPLLTLSIAEATLRFALDKEKSKQEVLSCSLLFTVLSIILLLCAYPFISRFGMLNVKDYGIYFILIFAFFNINNTFSNFIKGIGKTKLFAITGILQTVAIIVSNVVLLVFCEAGVVGYLMSIVIGYAIPATVAFFCGGIYKYLFPFRMSSDIVKEMLKYSIPMIPTLLAWSINTSIDKYMIIAFCGVEDNGLYSVAHKIPTLLTTITTIFLQAWQISAVVSYEKDNKDYTEIYRWLNTVNLFATMAVIILAKFMARFLFSNDFYAAWKFVPFLTVSAFYSTASGFLASSFRAAKKTKLLFVSVMLGAIINILLNIVLLNWLSTLGAAIATAVSFGIVWLMRIVLVQKVTPIRINVSITVLSQVLLFAAAAIYSLEIKYSLIFTAVIFLAITLINFKDLKKIIMDIMATLCNFLKKRRCKK